MEYVQCAGCKINEKGHEIFDERAVMAFETVVFDNDVLADRVLRGIENFLSAYDEKDIEQYMRDLDPYGLADFEKHPFDYYRYENCELCKRTVFFMMLSFALMERAVARFRNKTLTIEQRDRVENILLGLLDFIPQNSFWAEAYCNFIMSEANRFIESPEEKLDVESEREWVKDCIFLFPNVVAKAIDRVNGAGIYLQYLEDFMNCCEDESVRSVIREMLNFFNDRYGEMPVDPYETPELERNPYFMYGVKLEKDGFLDSLKKVDQKIQKMILQDFGYGNSTAEEIEKDHFDCVKSNLLHLSSLERIKNSLFKRMYKLYNSSHKKKLFEKIYKNNDSYYLRKHWEETESTFAKFKKAVDMFYHFKSLSSGIDFSTVSLLDFLEKAGRELEVDENKIAKAASLIRSDMELERERGLKEIPIPSDRYKYHYYVVKDAFKLLEEYLHEGPALLYKTRVAIIDAFEEIFDKYVSLLTEKERHLVKDWNKFEEIVQKLKHDLYRARKEAWLHSRFKWFEAKFGFCFCLCFPGVKVKGKRPNYECIFDDHNDRGVCGAELVSTCLKKFYEGFIEDEENYQKVVQFPHIAYREWREWLDKFPFHEYLKDEKSLKNFMWCSWRRMILIDKTNFFGIEPFFAEGSWDAERRGWDEIAEMIREILESEESDEELEKRYRDKYIGITGIFGRDGRIQDEEEEINEDQEREGEEESVQNDDVQGTTVQETDLIDFVLEDEKKQKKQRRKGILDRLKETVSENVKDLLERKEKK